MTTLSQNPTVAVQGLTWTGEPVAVTIERGLVASVDPAPHTPPEALQRTILPGLYDHHVHLRSWAARARSIDASAARSTAAFQRVLASAVRADAGDARIVGYDDTALGDLTGALLDELHPGNAAIRVQHRSGHQWVFNAVAAARLRGGGVDVPADGVLWHADDSITAVFGSPRGDVAGVVAKLNRLGVVGVDDLTPTAGDDALATLAAEVHGRLNLSAFGSAGVRDPRWDVKILPPESSLPSPDELAAAMDAIRPRVVAVHTVTAESLAIATAAFEEAFTHGDRLEHAFVTPASVPAQLVAATASRGTLRIGVQPGFLRSHGDRHARHGAPADVADYMRLRSWVDAGAHLLGGTDAPFGPSSPWVAMQSAVDRTTSAGLVLGAHEALSPEQAFTLFTRDGLDPSGPRLDNRLGEPADLCIIAGAWEQVRANLGKVAVVATMRGGRYVWRRDPSFTR